ncbi:hypothetical protein L6452_43951 [Arctium lappa]|uniref:Uncharacterized protein n=1 Tax=Arctium lappa TaxID=4217 RepID=A0ACB8XEF1_ARCLA|nr:hypothetical protein L6452_43951 [Arctium lappa]
MNSFQFAGEKLINSRLENDSILTDIVGCLAQVGDVETVSGGFRKRDLEIISDYSVTCKVTLWGEVGERFIDEHKIDQDKGPFIIIFTSMRIKKYLGVVNFATTSATKVYVNLKHPYVSSLIERFSCVCPRVKFLEPIGVIRKTVKDEMFENRMTIEQLMRADWLNESKGYITIMGVIDDIDTQYGWYYLGCKGCCRKIYPTEGVYTCDSCDIQSDTPLTLYKLRLVVRDETGVTTCVVLH